MNKRRTRVIVISDLHLGGERPFMMSQPDLLAAFLSGLPAKLDEGEGLELVIAGDFVDFLAMPPQAPWTPDPTEACKKLDATTTSGPFEPVFDALSELVNANHRLVLIVGNHDVELALPPVQANLRRRLGAHARQIQFVDDGRAYRIGGALIEHGNRYDGANINDWENLRAIGSALSRFEAPNAELEVSAGSMIVDRVVNSVKRNYPFIDLLQPSGELVAFLLLSFEPGLKWDIDKLASLFRGQRALSKTMDGAQPAKTRHVAFSPLDEHDEELARVFGDDYQQMRAPSKGQVGKFTDWLGVLSLSSKDSLSEIIDRGDPIPPERLEQIRVTMRRLLLNDKSYKRDGDTEQYGKAAERIAELAEETGDDLQVVVMGHTHLARHIGPERLASYINTGTWADVLRVPEELLEPDGNQALETFLHDIKGDERRDFLPTYAELRIGEDGTVAEARLRSATDE